MIAALFSVLLLAAETPATTVDAASAPDQETATKAAVKEKKICRIDPANTGTRMKKKQCLTQNEWDMQAKGKNAADLKTLGAR